MESLSGKVVDGCYMPASGPINYSKAALPPFSLTVSLCDSRVKTPSLLVLFLETYIAPES